MNKFPNKAGDHPDTDSILEKELHQAGISTIWEQDCNTEYGQSIKDMIRKNSGEVKTSIIGVLHGWEFKRAWYYWICSGPGIPLEYAQLLHDQHGKYVRVDGDAGCVDPKTRFKGLACGSYHVDSPEGLKALADTIKLIIQKHSS